MKIALAQLKSIPGDVRTNLENHLSFIRQTESSPVDAIFFPELSLTGYTPKLSRELAINIQDTLFNPLRDFSYLRKVFIGVGFPLLSKEGVKISMAIFQPNGQTHCYNKIYLHPDEERYFVPGKKCLNIRIGDEIISPAICYESLQTTHHEESIINQGQVYLASVAKSSSAMEEAKSTYSLLARKYRIHVLIVNATGQNEQFFNGGKSGVWTPDGKIVSQLSEDQERILIYDTITHKSAVL